MKRALILAGFVMIASCAKREVTSEKIVHVGEPLELEDSRWTVIEAKDLGKSLRPNNTYAEPKDTSGHFVLVRFKVINRHKNPESVLEPPKIVDDKSHEIERMALESLYVPSSSQTLGIEPLPPAVEKEFASIFDCPADAKNLKLQVRGLGLLTAKRSVDLAL